MSNLINGKKYAVTFYVEELGESKTEEATYNEAEESFFFCEFEGIGIHREWVDDWADVVEPKDGAQYRITFYAGYSLREELAVYDKGLDTFFLDGNESVGVDNDCVDEWVEV